MTLGKVNGVGTSDEELCGSGSDPGFCAPVDGLVQNVPSTNLSRSVFRQVF